MVTDRGTTESVPRAIWTGSVTFGLVNVPVGMYSATEEHEVSFHQFERGTSSRIRYKRINEDTGEEVDYDDIVKGAEVGDGQYVIITPEELEAVEPGRSRTIDISDFVDAAEIDRRLRAFGRLKLKLDGRYWPVTRLREGAGAPGLTTADGQRLVVERVDSLPVPLHRVVCALRR